MGISYLIDLRIGPETGFLRKYFAAANRFSKNPVSLVVVRIDRPIMN